jgi:hypothetical protein
LFIWPLLLGEPVPPVVPGPVVEPFVPELLSVLEPVPDGAPPFAELPVLPGACDPVAPLLSFEFGVEDGDELFPWPGAAGGEPCAPGVALFPELPVPGAVALPPLPWLP